MLFHVAIVAFAIFQAFTRVEFPDQAPDQMVAFRIDAEPPPPPPPPPPPAAPVRRMTPAQTIVTTAVFVPTEIPDVIPTPAADLPTIWAADDGMDGGVEGESSDE